MIEIFRKGFRLDIPTDQIVTFKKSQNLNGVQNRYAYSNTGTAKKTANNIKLLELFDQPSSMAGTLMNGYTVDVTLNGSIQMRNQTFQVTKNSRETFDWYVLYTDNALVVKLKEQYVNSIVTDLKYKKTVADFIAKAYDFPAVTALVETQPKTGLYIVEEMPILINIQELIKRLFVSNSYTTYGDFFTVGNEVSKYYVAPNQGTYQIYGGVDDGFSPTFDANLDLFTFLSQTLAFFNCSVVIDDTYKTVTVNGWANLGNYKTNYVDYSRFYLDYQDYTFQSKLAKRNDMTYADSDSTFNSFFSNNLSSQKQAVYLASAFGSGTLNIFDDSPLQTDGTVPLRPNGAVGESSAVRIFKISGTSRLANVYQGGIATPVASLRAVSVSMRDVYTAFHKEYTEFILTPLIQNVIFRYDAILAATFDMTKVFFIEQLSSYWLPLELGYTTKKDSINVRSMLVKKRKVPSPILNNFNSVLLDFKEKALFPLEYLLGMYPMPPNEYPIEEVVFKSYDQTKNRLYVNDVLVPAASLPQVFSQSTILSIKLEANEPGDVTPDTDTDSLYIQVVDTNGGVSNEAYITIKHTGKASLESNFIQLAQFHYSRAGFDSGHIYVNSFDYANLGLKPEINNTVHAVMVSNGTGPADTFNLIVAGENYTNVKLDYVVNFTIQSGNNGLGRAKCVATLIAYNGTANVQVLQKSVTNNSTQTFNLSGSTVIASLVSTKKIRLYWQFDFENTRSADAGSIDVDVKVNSSSVKISTIKTV